MVQISVSDLKSRPGSEIEFKTQAKWPYLITAAARIPILAPVRVSGRITNTGRLLVVKGQVATTLELTCDRCLEKFRYSAVVPLEEEYAAASQMLAGTGEDGEADEVRPLIGDFINLQPAVEEALILALPMKWLCRENCQGLCPRCGQNLNAGPCQCDDRTVDPRLAILAELLRQREGEN
ncbi:MAG: hypothetical protein PWQ18_429 [Clostridia bacterium]|nr:hypothetical protein [Clostridia bacterium]